MKEKKKYKYLISFMWEAFDGKQNFEHSLLDSDEVNVSSKLLKEIEKEIGGYCYEYRKCNSMAIFNIIKIDD